MRVDPGNCQHVFQLPNVEQAAAGQCSLVDTRHRQVECDLRFVFRYIMFYLIYCCARWHAACLVQAKEEQ